MEQPCVRKEYIRKTEIIEILLTKQKKVENSLVPEGTLIRDPLLRPSSVHAATGNITFSSPISKKRTR